MLNANNTGFTPISFYLPLLFTAPFLPTIPLKIEENCSMAQSQTPSYTVHWGNPSSPFILSSVHSHAGLWAEKSRQKEEDNEERGSHKKHPIAGAVQVLGPRLCSGSLSSSLFWSNGTYQQGHVTQGGSRQQDAPPLLPISGRGYTFQSHQTVTADNSATFSSAARPELDISCSHT